MHMHYVLGVFPDGAWIVPHELADRLRASLENPNAPPVRSDDVIDFHKLLARDRGPFDLLRVADVM